MNPLLLIAALQLCWVAPTENVDGSSLTDLDGYYIYWGDSSRNYPAGNVHEVMDESLTCANVTLAPGTYYFAMTAYDEDGNESAYSNEVLKTEDGGPLAPVVAAAGESAYIIVQTGEGLVLLDIGTVSASTDCEAGTYIRDDNGVLAYKVPTSSVTPYNASQQLVVTFARCNG